MGGVTSGKYKRQKAADTATGCHGQQGPTCDNLPSCRLIMLLAYNLNLFSSTENDSDHAMAFTHPNPLALCRWLEFTLCSTRNSVLSQWSDALSPGRVQPRRFIYLRFKPARCRHLLLSDSRFRVSFRVIIVFSIQDSLKCLLSSILHRHGPCHKPVLQRMMGG